LGVIVIGVVLMLSLSVSAGATEAAATVDRPSAAGAAQRPAPVLDAKEDIALCWVDAAVLSRYDLSQAGMAQTSAIDAACLQEKTARHLIALFEGREAELFAGDETPMTPEGSRKMLGNFVGLYKDFYWMLYNRSAACLQPDNPETTEDERRVDCGTMWHGAAEWRTGSFLGLLLMDVVARRQAIER